VWWGFLAAVVGFGGPVVEWDAPTGCPSVEDARSRIVAELDPGGDLQVTVTVRAADEGFAATVAVQSDDGATTRELGSPSCETLLDAVALIAAAAQGQAEVPEAEPEPEPEPEPTQFVEAVEAVETGSEVTRDPGASVDTSASNVRPAAGGDSSDTAGAGLGIAAHVRGFGRIGWGLTPQYDLGGGLAAGLSWGRLRAEAFGGAVGPTEVDIDLLPGAFARVYAWSVGLRGCGIAWAGPGPRERLTLPICVAVEAGEVIGRGEGSDLQQAATHRGAWLGARVGPAAVVNLTRVLSLVADVELLASIVRPGFSVRGAGDVHRPWPAGICATVGIELHFPRRISRAGGIR